MLEMRKEGLLDRVFKRDMEKGAWFIALPRRAANGQSAIDLEDFKRFLMAKTARR